MSNPTTFFRLLHVPIDAKGDALAERISALNAAGSAEETYTLDPAAFAQITGSPFAYWVGDSIRRLFVELPCVESEGRAVRVGDHPGDQERYLRLFWETPKKDRDEGRKWLPYQKGGAFSPYYADIHLVVDWDPTRETYYDFHGRPGRSSEHPSNYQFFLRPGLTWPRRTNGFSVRSLPRGCIFADKGPVVFVSGDDQNDLLSLLATMNSLPFGALVRVQLARTELAQSYEVGLIQNTPIPPLSDNRSQSTLAAFALEAHGLQRDRDRADETSHAFCMPGLAAYRDAPTLREASAVLDAEEAARQARLAAIQKQIDDLVFDLYGFDEADRTLVRREAGGSKLEADEEGVGDDEEAEEEAVTPQDPVARVQDLLMWCVGVAFGRWDIGKALDPSLLPPLGGPFDPLPRHAPGALIEDDGQRTADALQSRPAIFHLQSAILADGILVDDPSHPSDIVRRVQEVLELLWGERAEAVENEACEILGVKSLREFFRDPRRFFAYHIKRYSKSRRKAPIYWLLQSERRSYAVWLYYHRIGPMTLYTAGRDYTDSKIALERSRLDDLRAGLGALSGTSRRNQEREVERQEKLVAEVIAFGKMLDKIALANLPPDPNDGVLISIAPLHALIPWTEATRMWNALRSGQYGWSTMSKQLTTTDV